MIFSVWNYAARKYEYFEAPGTSADYGARGTRYRPLSEPPQGSAALGGLSPTAGLIGFAPEALGMPLPRDAMPVGSGSEARGVIAVQPTHRTLGAWPPHLRRMPKDNMSPSYPSVWEESGATAVTGLGADEAVAPPTEVVEVKTSGPAFGQIVAAACIASVVGVFVQRALKKK